MAWKIRRRGRLDFERPAIHLVNDDVHLSVAGQTVQVWIGADEPMHGRLLLVADPRGLRVEWQKGYTPEDLGSAASVLRHLGVPKPLIAEVFAPLHRQLREAVAPEAEHGGAAESFP